MHQSATSWSYPSISYFEWQSIVHQVKGGVGDGCCRVWQWSGICGMSRQCVWDWVGKMSNNWWWWFGLRWGCGEYGGIGLGVSRSLHKQWSVLNVEGRQLDVLHECGYFENFISPENTMMCNMASEHGGWNFIEIKSKAPTKMVISGRNSSLIVSWMLGSGILIYLSMKFSMILSMHALVDLFCQGWGKAS